MIPHTETPGSTPWDGTTVPLETRCGSPTFGPGVTVTELGRPGGPGQFRHSDEMPEPVAAQSISGRRRRVCTLVCRLCGPRYFFTVDEATKYGRKHQVLAPTHFAEVRDIAGFVLAKFEPDTLFLW